MEPPESIHGMGTDSAATVSHAETQDEWLLNALGELTNRQRFVVECRFGLRGDREYNFYEIAAFMGITHKAVRYHYYRAMVKLERLADGTHFPFISRMPHLSGHPLPSVESTNPDWAGRALSYDEYNGWWVDEDTGEYLGLNYDPWAAALAFLDS